MVAQSEWEDKRSDLPRLRFTCGYCGSDTGVREGYRARVGEGYGAQDEGCYIYICGLCNCPSYFDLTRGRVEQTPAPVMGRSVQNLPDQVAAIYDEARRCTSAGAFTACTLTCRKLLMHLAVDKGAEKDISFMGYVEFLAVKGYVPPNGKAWVDHIRQKGNEANHVIVMMTRAEAEQILAFVEMLLVFIYEFPSRLGVTSTELPHLS